MRYRLLSKMRVLGFSVLASFLGAVALAGETADSPATIESGTKLLRDANYAEAVKAFTTVLEKSPKNAAALAARSEAYFRLGQSDKALADTVVGSISECSFALHRMDACWISPPRTPSMICRRR